MCGIFIIIHSTHGCQKICNCTESFESLTSNKNINLVNRGPDRFGTVHVQGVGYILDASASLLQQQGLVTERSQPILSESKGFLLWNGEVFNPGLIPEGQNDSQYLYQQLGDMEDLLPLLASVQGPWAFAYWQNEKQKLWFGRDHLGRRSLLWKYSNQDCETIEIASVAPKTTQAWAEVPAIGVYCLDLSKLSFSLELYPWSSTTTGSFIDFSKESLLKNATISKQNISCPISHPFNEHLPIKKNKTESLQEYFQKLYAIGDEITNLKLENLDPPRVFEELNGLPIFENTVKEFLQILSQAVQVRVERQLMKCKDCININTQGCQHSSLCILFSGGIDSMIITLLADQYLPSLLPIDLLNVSFENSTKQHHSSKKGSTTNTFESPDRKTALIGLAELKKLCPFRTWNFVEINVTTEELKKERDEIIRHLVEPSETVLDDSIGCALWFACRGKGCLKKDDGSEEDYTSPARVVLLGMGADEQLAGYSRHRQKYYTAGWKGLMEEMKLEIDRISNRNLGRDDRVISDHGREARFPFLDERVVGFLNHLPVHFKSNLELPRGMGEKLLLRLAAASLGLKDTSSLPKRAIQFGSRIASSERKEKGNDRCDRLRKC